MKIKNPGRWWASGSIIYCGAFSIWANVTYGEIRLDNVIASVFPVGVLWLNSHMMGYFLPPTKLGKFGVFTGLGIVLIVAFVVSGWHIVTKTMESGQPDIIAWLYPFLADWPIFVAFLILIKRVETDIATKTAPSRAKAAKKAVPAKVTPAPKATIPAKRTTPAKKAATPKALPNAQNPVNQVNPPNLANLPNLANPVIETPKDVKPRIDANRPNVPQPSFSG